MSYSEIKYSKNIQIFNIDGVIFYITEGYSMRYLQPAKKSPTGFILS